MNSNLYLALIINLITIYYLYIFFRNNKNVINTIKFGKTLFFLTCLLIIVSGTAIFFDALNKILLIFLIPLLLTSTWFSYKFYRIKNSLQDYLYVGVIVIYSLIIFYNLYY